MSSVQRVVPPALTVLAPEQQDTEMRECGSTYSCASSDGERSPKARNQLGLTLPGSGHSIDAMLRTCRASPPRRIRIIHEADTGAVEGAKNTLKTPPLICEQGPSAPSSPTSPSPAARSAKRPCPLSVDALQRLNLLSPNYYFVAASTTASGGPLAMDPSKLPPISPSYPTSDLGSSPRSSISASHYSALGINPANWTAFRDAYARRHCGSGTGGAHAGSGDLDSESDCGGGKEFLSPHQLLSPAPFSPFSDYGVADLHASASATPYSSRSPNLSPSPLRRHSGNLHFSFEQTRSRSSLSNQSGPGAPDSSHLTIPQPRSLDQESRERSRSEGEALGSKDSGSGGEDERMDTSGPSPACPFSSAQQLHAGQKRRLIHKSWRTEAEEGERMDTGQQQQQRVVSQQESLGSMMRASTQVSRQPTIEEPPPSPTLVELFQPGDLDKERRRQVEDWIRQQTAALEAFRHSLVPPQQEANLLQVPTNLVPQNSLEQLWPTASAAGAGTAAAGGGPMRPATLWRRSRSESDVSVATAAAGSASGSSAGGAASAAAASRQRPMQQPQHPQVLVPLNEATHVCDHCGQGFSMHDRLSKHIASRHRDRSASMNDENNRVHKCTLCPKSFGRSDMLTRHMRLHTGLRPYACQLCGQVFSRSDHLSTHQRTHTGEKPYRCPQCNYAASRRDMITRHMRTHLLPDGSPAPFTELQFPSISELSLNPSVSGALTPVTPRVGSPETESNATPTLAEAVQPLAATTASTGAAGSQREEQQRQHNQEVAESMAKLLSAAVQQPQPQQGLLAPHMMFSTLGAQLPPSLRRSSPNLLAGLGCAGGEYPSAFRPLVAGPATSSIDLSAAAALSAVQQLLQQQHQGQQQRLSLPSGAGLPFLLRQNSFGGLGFSAASFTATQELKSASTTAAGTMLEQGK